MSLSEIQQAQGAQFAPDGIPLHYGDALAEYRAALDSAVVMDRSHEGRIRLSGEDRRALLQRISTNDLLNMSPGEGRPTIFTNANGRILDRMVAYERDGALLGLGEAGRGGPLSAYLQRNIFFRDQVRLEQITAGTRQFDLHGPRADEVVNALVPGALALPALHGAEAVVAGVDVFIGRRKPISGSHWTVVIPVDGAAAVWDAFCESGLVPAGSLTYNVLRIRAGRAAPGHELSTDYIPLEVGLWDEVSFAKGCYTGQEILARMESRRKLARTIVSLALSQAIDAPVDIEFEGHVAGTLTSCATAPDGEIFALGVVRMAAARAGPELQVGKEKTPARIQSLPGAQPPAEIST